MRERRLNDDTALALAGSMATASHLPYPVRKTNWAADFYRALEHANRLAALANNLRVIRVESDAGVADESTLGVTAGAFTLGGTAYTYAGSLSAVTGLAADDTYYVYAQDDGGGDVEVLAVTDATGWPGTDHLKLATVTKAGGVMGLPDPTVFLQEIFNKA